jgi:hypothetical protein
VSAAGWRLPAPQEHCYAHEHSFNGWLMAQTLMPQTLMLQMLQMLQMLMILMLLLLLTPHNELEPTGQATGSNGYLPPPLRFKSDEYNLSRLQ